MINSYTVAFFGHRRVEEFFLIEKRLENWVEKLVWEKQYVEFLVGRNGDFDQLVSSVVLRAKKRCRDDNNALVLVLPYSTAEYRNNTISYQNDYDEIEFSKEAEQVHFKAAIQVRNREMVDRADLILCYVNKKSGGAYQTIQYARKANKKVINLADGEAPLFP